MTRHDPKVALKHMRDYAAEATSLAATTDRSGLEQNRILVLALIRLVEVIGEAATRVPVATRQQLPGVPWNDIVGTRNRLIHGYDKVDLDILWQIVTVDLPALSEYLSSNEI